MKRSLTLALLTASLGMPAVVAVSETCHVDFKEVWEKKVAAIQSWNKSHASYVARNHLNDPALAANTRRMKERARKALEVMCGEVGSISGDGFRDGDVGFVSRSDGGSSFLGFSGDLEGDSEGQLIALVAAVDYPTDDSPLRTSPEAPGYGGFGWYGSAGYIGGGGDSVHPPVVPIAEAPEPSTLALTFAPLLLLAICRLKKKAQLRLEEYAA